LYELHNLLILPSFPTRRSSDLDEFDRIPDCFSEVFGDLLRVFDGIVEDGGEPGGAFGARGQSLGTGAGEEPVDRSPALRVIAFEDRKSTRLNSSHVSISYAVFC